MQTGHTKVALFSSPQEMAEQLDRWTGDVTLVLAEPGLVESSDFRDNQHKATLAVVGSWCEAARSLPPGALSGTSLHHVVVWGGSVSDTWGQNKERRK